MVKRIYKILGAHTKDEMEKLLNSVDWSTYEWELVDFFPHADEYNYVALIYKIEGMKQE